MLSLIKKISMGCVLIGCFGNSSAQQIQWCQVRLADNAVSTCYSTRDNCMLFNKGSESTYTCMPIQK